MVGRAFSAIILLIIFFWIGLPVVTNGVHDWRTNSETQNFVVVTGGGVTTHDSVLTYDLFGNNTTDIQSITSTIDETPVATLYTPATNTLTISALSESETRTLTVNYYTEVNDPIMEAIGPFLTILLSMFIVGLIVWATVFAGKRGR